MVRRIPEKSSDMKTGWEQPQEPKGSRGSVVTHKSESLASAKSHAAAHLSVAALLQRGGLVSRGNRCRVQACGHGVAGERL